MDKGGGVQGLVEDDTQGDNKRQPATLRGEEPGCLSFCQAAIGTQLAFGKRSKRDV
jgi:hypothetical protein